MPFKKGQSGNPKGRQKKEREVEYSSAIQSECSIAEWKEICRVAVAQAKRGDEKARKWLSDNLVGLPVQKTEITGKDGEPIKTDDEGHNRAISKLADALGEIVSRTSAKQDGEVDTTE